VTEVVVNREQAEALCKLLIDSGDMTPMARMQLRKLWSGEATDLEKKIAHQEFALQAYRRKITVLQSVVDNVIEAVDGELPGCPNC
jgi:hypothetical protein